MSINCVSCTGRISNTGVPTGLKPFGFTQGLLYVPLVANDGTRNGIDVTSATLAQDIVDFINNPDPTKRAYPLLGLKSVDPTQAEATYETDDTNQKNKTLEGIKTMNFQKWGATNQEFAKLEDVCVEFGVYKIDNCGNLQGELEGDMLYPRDVNEGSYNADFMDATPTTTSKIMVQFDYDLLSSDADQWMIPFSSIEPFNMNQLKGMIDVNLEVLSVDSDTQITFKAFYDYGTAVQKQPFSGATTSDFTLYNNTTGSAIALTGATLTEDNAIDGQYVLSDIPTQTATNIVELDVFRPATANNVNGFEGVETTYESL